MADVYRFSRSDYLRNGRYGNSLYAETAPYLHCRRYDNVYHCFFKCYNQSEQVNIYGTCAGCLYRRINPVFLRRAEYRILFLAVSVLLYTFVH